MSDSVTVICPFGIDGGLISKAASLGTVRVLAPAQQAKIAADCGAVFVHTLPDEFHVTDESAFALWLAEKIRSWGDKVVLAPATVQLRNIMPMVAWHLRAGLTADCTALHLENGRLVQTRPAFGNNMVADIRTLSIVQIATVRPDTFRAEERASSDVQIIPESATFDDRTVALMQFTPYTEGTPLRQADIVVAGGLGIGSAEGFQKLAAFAEHFGAAVAASRSAVDAGFAPYRLQVGITGAIVSPKIYIAVGISGAVQHLSGMSGAEKVIAINTDPKAPIFDYADLGIVGDWETVMDQVLEELQ